MEKRLFVNFVCSLSLCVLLAGCGGSGQLSGPPSNPIPVQVTIPASTHIATTVFSEHEAMSEIYSSVMAYGFSKGEEDDNDYCKDGGLIISSVTRYSAPYFDPIATSWQEAKDYFPQLEQETWENFTRVNSQQIPFPSDLDVGCKYNVLDIAHNPPGQDIENCSVINYFSPVGFNSSKSQTMVARAADCGGYGCGALYFAEIVDGHWVVTAFDDAVCLGE